MSKTRGTWHSTVMTSGCYILSFAFLAFLINCSLISNQINGNYSSIQNPPDIAPNFSLNLTGVPAGVNASTSLDISVSGSQITAYKFKVGLSSTIDCASPNDYSAELSTNQSLAADIAPLADHFFTLCVVGKHFNGDWQAYSEATQRNWGKDTNQPKEVNFVKTSQSLSESSTSSSMTFTLSAPKSTDTIISFSVGGSAVYGSDHNLLASSVSIPSGDLSVTISYDIFDNGLDAPDKQLFIGIVNVSGDSVTIGATNIQQNVIKDDEGISESAFKTVSTGKFHSCGITLATNKLKCWGGGNSDSQVGDGTTVNRDAPVTIDSGTAYSHVSLGRDHSCGIVNTTGQLKCWGRGDNGKVGDGSSTDQASPVIIDSGTSYSQVALGAGHTCGIVNGTGEVRCWGTNTYGQLGDASFTTRSTPVVVDPGTSYSKISLGDSHTCAIVSGSQTLKCWGLNDRGQLGDGTEIGKNFAIAIDPGQLGTLNFTQYPRYIITP